MAQHSFSFEAHENKTNRRSDKKMKNSRHNGKKPYNLRALNDECLVKTVNIIYMTGALGLRDSILCTNYAVVVRCKSILI